MTTIPAHITAGFEDLLRKEAAKRPHPVAFYNWATTEALGTVPEHFRHALRHSPAWRLFLDLFEDLQAGKVLLSDEHDSTRVATIRWPAAMHRDAIAAAKAQNLSLNKWMVRQMAEALKPTETAAATDAAAT